MSREAPPAASPSNDESSAARPLAHRVELVSEERHDGSDEELDLARSLRAGRLGAARAPTRSGVGRHGPTSLASSVHEAPPTLCSGGAWPEVWRSPRPLAQAPSSSAPARGSRPRAVSATGGRGDRVGGAEGLVCPSLGASRPDRWHGPRWRGSPAAAHPCASSPSWRCPPSAIKSAATPSLHPSAWGIWCPVAERLAGQEGRSQLVAGGDAGCRTRRGRRAPRQARPGRCSRGSSCSASGEIVDEEESNLRGGHRIAVDQLGRRELALPAAPLSGERLGKRRAISSARRSCAPERPSTAGRNRAR
jgi:hypothetical protein